jgi:hypothetical protein
VTTTILPADGVTIWRVTGMSGPRWLRLRKGGDPLDLDADGETTAEPVTPADAAEVTAGAPPYLRQLWRLAEADPRWGWTVRKLPGDGHPVTGWFLAVEDPDGAVYRFTWVARSAGRMHLVAQTETVRATAGRLTGAPERGAPEAEAHP